MSDTWAACGCLPGVHPGSKSEYSHSFGKMFGMSVGWFGGWAKPYVQVEYANIIMFHIIFTLFVPVHNRYLHLNVIHLSVLFR